MINKENAEQCWISLILRTAVAILFGMAAVGKFMTGLGPYADTMKGMFANTFLPGWLLTPYIYVLPFVEAAIAIGLVIGLKLKETWILAAFTLITLAFGLTVAKQPAGDIYMFLIIACMGVYFSKHE